MLGDVRAFVNRLELEQVRETKAGRPAAASQMLRRSVPLPLSRKRQALLGATHFLGRRPGQDGRRGALHSLPCSPVPGWAPIGRSRPLLAGSFPQPP